MPILLPVVAAMTLNSAAQAVESGDRLLGTWEPIGGNCGSDNHVTYRRGGAYSAYAESGTWRLRGRKLQTFVSRRGEPGEVMRKVAPPAREEAVILLLSDGRMTVRTQSGSIRRLHRCR